MEKMAVSPSLVTWCSEELSFLLASETTDEFVSYLLAISDDQELREYLSQLLDSSNKQNAEFVEELMRRRNSGPALPQNFTVYRKSATQEESKKDVSKHKGKSRSKEKKSSQETISPSNQKSNTSPQLPPQVQPNQLQQQPTRNGLSPEDEQSLALQQGARRKTKFVPLYSQEGQVRSTIHLPGRHPCECQAHKHALVSNCLECGRVVCSQEGSGPCIFCGALVCNKEEQEILARNSKKSEKLRKKLMGEAHANSDASSGNKPNSIDRAIAHKDKLIEYDKTSVRRTKVHDDQSDYFSSDTNQWLNTTERGELKKREGELREQRHGSRLNKKFNLDFAGRKVVEQEAEEMYNSNDEVVQRVVFGNKARDEAASKGGHDATILNPGITREAPKFVSNTPTNTKQGSSSLTSSRRDGSSKTNPRVQDRELMEMSDQGQCLSMHQPWASLLVAGVKKHEGRTWYSPHRGRLWIAAAAKLASQEEIDAVEAPYRHIYDDADFPEHYPTSCLLGCVDMVDCLAQEDYRSKFPEGESSSPYVFICENPQELFIKFPVKGKHKIWRLDGAMHKAAKKGLRQILQHS